MNLGSLDRTLLGVALLALASAGCRNDDAASSGDDGGDTTDESTDDADDEQAEATSTETTDDSDDSDDTTDDTGGPVNVSGVVNDYVANQPIANALLWIYGDPLIAAESSATGQYTLFNLQPSTEYFVVIDGTEEYWGAVRPIRTSTVSQNNVPMAQISAPFMVQQEGLIQEQDDTLALDDSRGVVIVRLLQNSAIGAEITISPELPEGAGVYAPQSNGKPLLGSSTVEWTLLPVVVYFNVPAGEPGAVSFSAEHPERECTVLHPAVPIMARHVTLVDVDCPPPPDDP